MGNAYVTGGTSSPDFPTVNALDESYNGGGDAFVTKISSDNLQAGYTFNEGSGTIATDSSGNGNDGTIQGATWTTGKNGDGLSFDGIDDSVSIPLINNEELSICAWFHKNANDTTNADAIFGAMRWDFDP